MVFIRYKYRSNSSPRQYRISVNYTVCFFPELMKLLHNSSNEMSPEKNKIIVPPDLDNPPFYIPLKNISDRYELVQELGNGSFGSVTLAKAKFNINMISGYQNTLMDQRLIPNVSEENFYNKENGVVAIKTMMTRLPTLNDYTRVREIKFILAMPAHKHLVQIYELFIDNAQYQLHIVMECLEQNLYQLMRQRKRNVFSLPTLKSILSQILAGIRHIHQHNFFHRDIKPENILISPANRYYSKSWLQEGHFRENYVVKIADYGLARHVTNKNPYTAYVSTRWYRSPEILLRQSSYARPVDVWAFGCVALEVATFRPLFPGSDEMDQIWKILEVLGTPFITSEMKNTGYTPHGGIWQHAPSLAARLNLKFPYVEGVNIEVLLSNPLLRQLCEVIKVCLTWDPDKRANVNQVCRMPYFKETIVDDNYMLSNSSDSTNAERALMFAGIKPNGLQRPILFHENDENALTMKATQPILIKEPVQGKVDTSSLMPNIINFNHGGKPQKSSKEEVSLQEFLKETEVKDEEQDSESTLSGAEDDFAISREIQDNVHLYSLSGDPEFSSEPQLNDEGYKYLKIQNIGGRNIDEDNEEDEEDSLVDFYTNLCGAERPLLAGSNENDIPNYIHYPEPELAQRCHILDDMSMDSGGSQIPRGFMVPLISDNDTTTSTNTTVQEQHHSFTHVNGLTF